MEWIFTEAIVGGVVSGTLDAVSTHTIGKVAKKMFITSA